MSTPGHDHADDVAYPSSSGFLLVHLGCLGVFWSGMTAAAVVLGLLLYLVRIFAIGAGYHRYFAHRTFRTGRILQFCLAFVAQTSAQRGALWWAAMHRRHHRYSDTEADVHSPVVRGFLYAHVGWIFVPRNKVTDYEAVRDLSRYQELRWLDRHPYLPPILLGVASWAIAGWPGLVVGFCWSTVALWHATFSINSLAHLVGRRRYVTGDQSRNNWLLALLTLGEGWHNNHHAYQASVRQGFRWWECDVTYYVLCALSWVGLVWDLHVPPKAVIRGEQKLGTLVIDKVACQLAASFPVKSIASQVLETLAHTPGWIELIPAAQSVDVRCPPPVMAGEGRPSTNLLGGTRDVVDGRPSPAMTGGESGLSAAGIRSRLLSAGVRAEAFWNEIELQPVPTLDEVRRYARARLAQTPSLEEIAVSTRRRLLELVHSRLIEATSPSAISV
jgi:stearoyl-CoA desaturase (delta-9 desaturase)